MRTTFVIPTAMGSVAASATSPTIVIGTGYRVLWRVFVVVPAMVWQWLMSRVCGAGYPDRPVKQFLSLYRGVSFAMAFSAQRQEIAQVVAASQPQRDHMMHVERLCASAKSYPLLELFSAVLTLIPVTVARARGLSDPITARVWRGGSVAVNFNSNCLADGQCVSPTSIRTEPNPSTCGRWSGDFLTAMGASDQHTTTLRFARAFTRAIFGMLRRLALKDNSAHSARHHYSLKSGSVITGPRAINSISARLGFEWLAARRAVLLHRWNYTNLRVCGVEN